MSTFTKQKLRNVSNATNEKELINKHEKEKVHGRSVCKAHLGTCLGAKIGELFSRQLEAQQKIKYNVF